MSKRTKSTDGPPPLLGGSTDVPPPPLLRTVGYLPTCLPVTTMPRFHTLTATKPTGTPPPTHLCIVASTKRPHPLPIAMTFPRHPLPPTFLSIQTTSYSTNPKRGSPYLHNDVTLRDLRPHNVLNRPQEKTSELRSPCTNSQAAFQVRRVSQKWVTSVANENCNGWESLIGPGRLRLPIRGPKRPGSGLVRNSGVKGESDIVCIVCTRPNVY